MLAEPQCFDHHHLLLDSTQLLPQCLVVQGQVLNAEHASPVLSFQFEVQNTKTDKCKIQTLKKIHNIEIQNAKCRMPDQFQLFRLWQKIPKKSYKNQKVLIVDKIATTATPYTPLEHSGEGTTELILPGGAKCTICQMQYLLNVLFDKCTIF